jgi:DNA invertase Pin-like site-specific DNA recombinase
MIRRALTAILGSIPAVIRYVRKSTEPGERQAESHDRQREELEREWGEIPQEWYFEESMTGTTFDRPEFLRMLAFCEENRRPATDPGRVEMYDPSRFGRSLNAEGRPDIMEFIATYHRFERSGWQLHFLTVPRTGEPLADIINIAVYAYAAAIYSVNLSKNVTSGLRRIAKEGWWMGGPAPWGTRRMDSTNGRILSQKETASARARTILVPDPDVLPHWEPAARLLLQGATWDGIGEELFGEGIRGPRGGALGHSAIRNFLTRPELVGKIDVVDRTVDPHVVERIDAKWDAMVDVELFRSVQEEVERRASDSRNQQRRERGTFILRPVCGSCGGEFHGSRSAKVAGDGRAYVHGRPTIRDGELFDRFKGAGCKQYNVVADELECAIRDLILEERGSDSYEEEMRELLGARERFRGVADEAPASARSNVEDLQRKRSRVLSNSLELDLSSEEGDVARRPT